VTPPRAGELTALWGWGRSSVVRARELCSEDLAADTRSAVLTRGLGRSYGDASLPAREGEPVACSRRANRLLGFDAGSGWLRAEAGLSLEELLRVFLPRGWFPPVSPGTSHVTLGGMVAADVHGKNHHHAGSLGRHVRRLRLRTGGGEIVDCSREENPELFFATLGGMGLTGHMLDVELRLERLPSPWIEQELELAPDLEGLLGALRGADAAWPFTVAWVDSFARGRQLGRGAVIKGRWAPAERAPAAAPAMRRAPAVPFQMPSWLLNPASGRAFYELYRRVQRRGRRIVHPQPFFHPLDSLRHWNRLYGRRGFTQYQCVLPDHELDGARELFELLARLRAEPFLAVVKEFGEQGEGLLSFPRHGLTLTFDIPIGRERTQGVIDALNERVLARGGRVYLAKDAFTRAEHFRAMQPHLAEFARVREKWDPQRRLRSALSVRLLGDEA
jgi:FAD/FMN-containing dehydrogenase